MINWGMTQIIAMMAPQAMNAKFHQSCELLIIKRSMQSTSRVNRFKIRPMGVVQKKVMVAFNTVLNISLCKFWLDFNMANVNRRDRVNTAET